MAKFEITYLDHATGRVGRKDIEAADEASAVEAFLSERAGVSVEAVRIAGVTWESGARTPSGAGPSLDDLLRPTGGPMTAQQRTLKRIIRAGVTEGVLIAAAVIALFAFVIGVFAANT
jgi:hypothetical protein